MKHSWQSEGEEERASKLVKMEETLIASMRDARSSGERKSTRGGGGQRKKKIGATNVRDEKENNVTVGKEKMLHLRRHVKSNDKKKHALELTPQRQEAAPRQATAPPLLDRGIFS